AVIALVIILPSDHLDERPANPVAATTPAAEQDVPKVEAPPPTPPPQKQAVVPEPPKPAPTPNIEPAPAPPKPKLPPKQPPVVVKKQQPAPPRIEADKRPTKVETKPAEGRVHIVSTSGARGTITVDGKSYGATSELTIQLPPGTHQISIKFPKEDVK